MGKHANSSKPESNTRSRILEAAANLLIRRQGAEVSVADIGKAADVSRQAVYLHFADRGDLFVALFRYVDEKRGLAAELERIRAAPSGIAGLRAMASLQARTNPDIWPLARASDAIRRTDPAVEQAWQDRLQDRHLGCKAIIKRLDREGSLRKDLSTNVATDLLWTLTSLRMWEDLVKQRKWKANEYEDQLADLLLRTLTNSPARQTAVDGR
jgi:AcrR family transcriptional regulator